MVANGIASSAASGKRIGRRCHFLIAGLALLLVICCATAFYITYSKSRSPKYTAENYELLVELFCRRAPAQFRPVEEAARKGHRCNRCELSAGTWQNASATAKPRNVYFDLGVRDGSEIPPPSDHIKNLDRSYHIEVDNKWSATIKHKVDAVNQRAGKEVATALLETAVWMCDGQVETRIPDPHHDGTRPGVGASLRGDFKGHPGYQQGLMRKNETDPAASWPVRMVKALNFVRFLAETVTKEDHVVVKMDIEGAEFEVLPCLVGSPYADLVDVLIMERHDNMVELTPCEGARIDHAMQKLREMGTTVKGWH